MLESVLLSETKIKRLPGWNYKIEMMALELIFVSRGMVYPIVMKLSKQSNIRMFAHLTDLLILNFSHVTL